MLWVGIRGSGLGIRRRRLEGLCRIPKPESPIPKPESPSPHCTVASVTGRLSSVDAFRGLTMAGMVIVNNPGTWDAVYWPLEHAAWNGWTPTDLIFPFFAFLLGVSLTLSMQTLTARPSRIVERGLLIICFGLAMAGFPSFNPGRWRIPGVLQRLGLCYLAAAFIYRRTRRMEVLAGIVAVLLIGYWIVLVSFGDLTAEGNIGARIDRTLM